MSPHRVSAPVGGASTAPAGIDSIGDDIGRIVLDAAGVQEAEGIDAEGHVQLIAASAAAERAARTLLHRSVVAARAGGASWSRIGAELGMSRQAAQQRFGADPSAGEESAEERWLGPVTAFDELPELEAAGRQGWRTVGAGMLAHRMRRTDTQWEHRRILWRVSLDRERQDGWDVGCRAFPWIYLVRDLGIPPVAD
ncbi:hypothetical protein MTS1_00091 [Microbacterium sp. TS-1]|uniref:hypothetical protein n=1 Tax=Microbacterium sp. TS-1 TaxID=1344956 RepID=UPI00038F59AA|nr:hypothetical protein [Microbacterium sp. TS-1]GAD32748.1 hypothetical protein MTS1_00091 [Microbacterium sp. TS-1]